MASVQVMLLLWLQVGYVLVWNVMSVVVGVAGVAFLCWQLVSGPPDMQICMPWHTSGYEWDGCHRLTLLVNVS